MLCRVNPAETLQSVLSRLGVASITIDGCAFPLRDLSLQETNQPGGDVRVHGLVSADPIALPRVTRQLSAQGYETADARQTIGFLEALPMDHINARWLTKMLVVPDPCVLVALPNRTVHVPVAMIVDARAQGNFLAFLSRGYAPNLIDCSHFVLACPNRLGASVHP